MPAEPSPIVVCDGPIAEAPLTLAHLHRTTEDKGRVHLRFPALARSHTLVDDLVVGAGFVPDQVAADPEARWLDVLARRDHTLPDFVGTGMQVLICGLNPSLHAADAGVGYAGPGNRFWPAMLESGLTDRPLDPVALLNDHSVGMTDLVKRATPRAAQLGRSEYLVGVQRVARLVSWLGPRVICMVGLHGWRLAVDRTADAGLQSTAFAGRPVYVMPSTSGLNARTSLGELVEHLGRVRQLSQQDPL